MIKFYFKPSTTPRIFPRGYIETSIEVCKIKKQTNITISDVKDVMLRMGVFRSNVLDYHTREFFQLNTNHFRVLLCHSFLEKDWFLYFTEHED